MQVVISEKLFSFIVEVFSILWKFYSWIGWNRHLLFLIRGDANRIDLNCYNLKLSIILVFNILKDHLANYCYGYILRITQWACGRYCTKFNVWLDFIKLNLNDVLALALLFMPSCVIVLFLKWVLLIYNQSRWKGFNYSIYHRHTAWDFARQCSIIKVLLHNCSGNVKIWVAHRVFDNLLPRFCVLRIIYLTFSFLLI